MMQFQVFLCLWSVTSCSCIYKIRKVAKTKVSNPNFIKVKTRPRLHLNTPPNIYVTVLEDLHNTAQMFAQRKKA